MLATQDRLDINETLALHAVSHADVLQLRHGVWRISRRVITPLGAPVAAGPRDVVAANIR